MQHPSTVKSMLKNFLKKKEMCAGHCPFGDKLDSIGKVFQEKCSGRL